MKKVGLITYYGDNYGGVLQAYALQHLVKVNDFDCELISNDFQHYNNGLKRLKNRFANLTAAIKDPSDYLSKRKVYHKYAAQNVTRAKRFESFRRDNLIFNKTGYTSYDQYLKTPPKYDVYLCGSDQIWNPNLYSDNGFYFAEFAPDSAVKISYASSIGISSINKKQRMFMSPLLNRLDVISTREQKGAEIINEISEKTATVVLDPTLLLTNKEWSEVACPRMIQEPYVFCYLFGEREYVAKVKKKVKELTGMRVVCIPFVPRELSSDDEKIFDAGPAEFISLIKYASLVLTDSFHATAFSINLKTPFVSLCRFNKNDKKSMNDRLVTILDMVDLNDRLIDENDSISVDFLYDIDFDHVHELLNQKRQNDREFLMNALNYDKVKGTNENL